MRQNAKPVIAVLIGAAWPDNGASGPVQSVFSVIEAAKDLARFELFSRNGPPDGAAIVPHKTRVEKSWGAITYLEVGAFGARGIIGLLDTLSPDRIWLNSVWDREFTMPILFARKLGKIAGTSGLLSTRGEFSEQALALKSSRKQGLLRVLKMTKLLDGITLHTTGERESVDVRKAFPNQKILNIGNVRTLDDCCRISGPQNDHFEIAYVGRISPVKGLHDALLALTKICCPVRFSIFGPVHDAVYWSKCQVLIAKLPDNVKVAIKGSLANNQVNAKMAAADLFLNTSASENFGHTIFEALQAGTPVITGTNTPWSMLDARFAGHNIKSDDHAAIAKAIDQYFSLPNDTKSLWRRSARKLAEDFVNDDANVQLWRRWVAGDEIASPLADIRDSTLA